VVHPRRREARRVSFFDSKIKRLGATMVSMLWWWIIGAVVALALFAGIWAFGSFIYLKVRYPRMPEHERRRFADLDKEQRTPRSGSL
jgi:hypothetical protein